MGLRVTNQTLAGIWQWLTIGHLHPCTLDIVTPTGHTGFEPVYTATNVLCLTAWLIPFII